MEVNIITLDNPKRLFLILILFFISTNSFSQHHESYRIGINQNNSSDEDKLVVSLKKNKYKIFEPIDALVGYIKNNFIDKNKMFSVIDNIVQFEIQDTNGNIYNYKDIFSFDKAGSSHFDLELIDRDTISYLEVLNQYGKQINNHDSDYFSYNRYFPPGKYRGFAFTTGDSIKSNVFEFEITDLDQQDMEILALLKHNEFEIISINYPESYFAEYIAREKVRIELGKYSRNEIGLVDLINHYKYYIDNFPDSYYNIYFIPNYLRFSEKAHKITDDLIEELIVNHQGTFLENYLRKKITKVFLKFVVEK